MPRRKRAGNWQEFDSFGWHDRPEGAEDWAIVYTHNRDSELLDQSNAAEIDKALAPFMEGETPMSGRSIMGTGLADGLTGMPSGFTATARLPKLFAPTMSLAARLADYPVLNEEDFSRREYEATLENLLSEGFDSDCFAPPEGWEGEVFSWLWDHNESAVENRDGQGGYATKEEIGEALDALGYRILWVVSYVDLGEVKRSSAKSGKRKSALPIARGGFPCQLCGAPAATRQGLILTPVRILL